MAAFILSACAAKTTKKIETQTTQITGDTYSGDETVKYLATGVPDRVFFATNRSVLTTASRDTLRKQAACLYFYALIRNKSLAICLQLKIVLSFILNFKFCIFSFNSLKLMPGNFCFEYFKPFGLKMYSLNKIKAFLILIYKVFK